MKIEHISLNSHLFKVVFVVEEHNLCPAHCSFFSRFFSNIFSVTHFEKANETTLCKLNKTKIYF